MRTERLLVVAAGLAALAIQLPIYDRAFSLLDEGYLLALADDINRGRLLYRDVDVANPLPGAFYLLAWWFRLVGTSVWASRLLAVGVFALQVALVVRIARTVLSARATVALLALLLCYRIWAFPHWHLLSYSSLSATFLAASVAALVHHLSGRGRSALLASGALAGAGIVCKQDYGLGVSGALGLFLLLRPFLARRAGAPSPGGLGPAAVFAAGATAVLAPVLGYFVARGVFGQLVEQTLFRPLAIAGEGFYAGLPALRPFFRQDVALRAQIGNYLPGLLLAVRWPEVATSWLYRETAVWDAGLKVLFYAPFLVWGTCAAVWRPGFRADVSRATTERRLLLLAWAGGFLIAFNRPRDWVHLMMLYPPVLVLATALAAERLARAPRLLTAASVILLLLLSAASLDLGAAMRRHFDTPLPGERAGVYADAQNGPIMVDMLRYIDTHAPPGVPVPSLPLQPMIGFLAGREGVGGYYVIWPGRHPGRDQRIVDALRTQEIPVIAYSVSPYMHLGRFRDVAPELHEYLARNYRIDAVFAREPFGPILAGLARRTSRASGTSLLDRIADVRPPSAVAATLWPFTPVLAEQVGTTDAPVVARLTVDVPADQPALAFSYGLNPDRWLDVASGPFTFAIAIEDETGRSTGTPFGATVDPYRNLAERRWIDGRLGLAAHAGQRVTLAFSITAPVEVRGPLDLAGWADPRLVAR